MVFLFQLLVRMWDTPHRLDNFIAAPKILKVWCFLISPYLILWILLAILTLFRNYNDNCLENTAWNIKKFLVQFALNDNSMWESVCICTHSDKVWFLYVYICYKSWKRKSYYQWKRRGNLLIAALNNNPFW